MRDASPLVIQANPYQNLGWVYGGLLWVKHFELQLLTQLGGPTIVNTQRERKKNQNLHIDLLHLTFNSDSET